MQNNLVHLRKFVHHLLASCVNSSSNANLSLTTILIFNECELCFFFGVNGDAGMLPHDRIGNKLRAKFWTIISRSLRFYK